MPKAHLHVTVREDVKKGLEANRGDISLSKYVDTLLGVVLGIDAPETLEKKVYYPEILLNVAKQMSRLSKKERIKKGLPEDSLEFVAMDDED